MKKTVLLLAAMLFVGFAGFAQSFEKGSQGINVGLGLGPGWATSAGFSIGVNGSYEYAIVEVPMGSTLTGVVGVGGMVGTCFSTRTYGVVDYHSMDYFIAARGNYHFIFHDKFDPYASLVIGYRGYQDKYKDDGPEPAKTTYTGGDFRAGVVVGARYFFTDSFGAYAELGYLQNFLNIGVTFKID